MAAELSTTHDDIYREVRALLLNLFSLSGEQVIRGYSDNVPLPEDDFIMMNIIDEQELSTNGYNYSKEEGNVEVKQSVEVQMQIDFYGKSAVKFSRTFCQLWRDFYSCEHLESCQPLYCDNPKYLPFVNEKSQYEERYLVTAHLTYNPVITHGQEFMENAGNIEINKL